MVCVVLGIGVYLSEFQMEVRVGCVGMKVEVEGFVFVGRGGPGLCRQICGVLSGVVRIERWYCSKFLGGLE